MQQKEKVKFILRTLEQLFPEPPIPLQHQDPYTLLIAVLLSAQCTDARVNLVTPKLFALADTPEKMVRLPIKTIEEVIRSCGFFHRKAEAIHGLSIQLLEQYKGKVPCSFEALEALPGVGHKTASVVMCQAFGLPALPVDTHIHRLAKRWGLSPGRNVEQTEADLKKLFPKKEWNLLHLRMIYFARKYCPARGHHPDQCPICSQL